MAVAYKVLGQSAPAATTVTDLYTVPASTEAVLSTIIVCNRGTSAATFRIAVKVNGGTVANEDYIYYDLSIGANDTFAATLGITLDASDVIEVYASNANLTFAAFGQEIS